MAYRHKHVSVRKLGWRRVCKNFKRFGWQLEGATELTETTTTHNYSGRVVGDTIYVEDKPSTSTKVRVHLNFVRDSSDFANLYAVAPLEIIYNILFLIRRILGFFLPFALIPMAIIAFLGNSDSEIMTSYSMYYCIALSVWILFMILESVLAIISSKILKLK